MNPTQNSTGTLFNIQRFSIHDGPGIRTTVFLKGCNLHCIWCHNPESVQKQPEIQFFPEKCIACGECVKICPHGAQILDGNQRIYVRDLCQQCGQCTQDCFSGALVLTGKEWTPAEVLAEVEQDAPYYQTSQGGVTLSGGEPLLQPEFVSQLLEGCRERGFHTALDTAGNVSWKTFESLLPLTDLFLYDVKAFHEDIHRRATAVSNRLILENLRRLAETGKPIWVRIPVVPGINNSPDEIGEIARFLAPFKSVEWVELMPFHTLGAEKYDSLGRDYTARGITPPGILAVEPLLKLFESYQVHARIMK